MSIHSALPIAPDPSSATVDWLVDQVRSLDPTFDRIVRLTARLTGSPTAAFTLVTRDRVHVRAAHGGEPAPTVAHAGWCRDCAHQDQTLVLRDTGLDGARFFAAAPVRAPRGVPIGALSIAGPRARRLRTEDRAALLELRDLLEETLAVALTCPRDEVTGLAARRQLEDELEREWLRARRHARALAVLHVEVRGLAGAVDEVDADLRRVATTLRGSIRRAADAIGRIGRDRIAVVLSECDEHGAVVVAERLRLAVAKLAIPGVVAIVGGAVARPFADDESALALLQRAEAAGGRAGPDRSIVSSARLATGRLRAVAPIIEG